MGGLQQDLGRIALAIISFIAIALLIYSDQNKEKLRFLNTLVAYGLKKRWDDLTGLYESIRRNSRELFACKKKYGTLSTDLVSEKEQWFAKERRELTSRIEKYESWYEKLLTQLPEELQQQATCYLPSRCENMDPGPFRDAAA